MARLPSTGGDQDSWGDILNEYLLVSHTDDGRMKPLVVEYPYAASITPDVDTTEIADIGLLTGNVSVTNPSGTPIDGQLLTFRFAQDSTGGRKVTWDTQYVSTSLTTTPTMPTTANAIGEISFRWNVANSLWQLADQTAVPASAPTATIQSIAGLNPVLQNQGWQVIAGTGMNLSDNFGSNLNILISTRVNVIPSFTASHLVLVFANYEGAANGVGEQNTNSTPKIEVALEPTSIGLETTLTNTRTPVTFNGDRWKGLATEGITLSDPIAFPVSKGVPFFIWVGMSVGGFAVPYLGCYYTRGGTGPGSTPNTGEGAISQFNYVDSVLGGSFVQNTSTIGLAPSAILGYSNVALPSAGLMGDSICDNTADGGMGYNNGGYLQRAVSAQLNLNYTYPVTPPVGYVKVAKGGETLAGFLANNYRRFKLLQTCSTIVCQYGTNDIQGGATLSQIQALYIQNANNWLAMGKSFVGCTILPRVTSTDAFATYANQTPIASESVRTAFNSWMRDVTATGFAQATSNPGNVSVFDAAAVIEVNSSGTSTLNGGYWPIRGSAVHTGTLTSVTSISNITDSGASTTQDTYRGNCLCMTSGVAAQSQSDIVSSSSGGNFSLDSSSLTSTPSIGDTYSIFSNQYTVDGTHPTTYGHMLIANQFPISLIK